MNKKIKIGILGGSGFYEFLDNADEVEIETPFGRTSDKISVGDINGVGVAFLPRHGRGHKFPPHAIPYRANLWALRQLGCETGQGFLWAHAESGENLIAVMDEIEATDKQQAEGVLGKP